MDCTQCLFDNPEGMRFCVECGSPLMIACGECGAEMLLTYKFCGRCGKPLEAADARSKRPLTPARIESPLRPAGAEIGVGAEGEHKQVTVVSCEVALLDGETSPDALHTHLSQFFETAQQEVERYGGQVSRISGRGFMALFGAPVAYEDHLHRAVLAARGLRKRHAKETPGGAASGLRLAIETGEVVVGGASGMAVGKAPEIASRLQMMAAPSEILVGEAAARLLRNLVLLERKTAADGSNVPGAWIVLEDDQRDFAQGAFAKENTSPLVGRERELSVLEGLCDEARRGHGQAVAISGEAGAGKSRLLHELYLSTYSRRDDISYLRGQCVSYGTGVPYHPLADMLRKASRIRESDDHAAIRRKLEASLRKVGTDPEGTLPFLLSLLGVREELKKLGELEPQAIQARTFAAMRRMLLDASRQSLVVVEIEDLQWIDATSADFLDTLIDNLAAARILVLLAFRPGYKPTWLDRTYAHQMNVGRLSEDDSRQLVASLLRRAGHSDETPDQLIDKADGNPFFLEQMATAMIEGTDAAGVPDTIQGMLMARIDRLPDEHRRLLRTASVLGRDLPVDLLEEIWDPALGDLRPLLEDLQRWELLHKAPSEDQKTYFFHQALTQEVVYQSLLESRRRELHGRVAQVLERLYEDRLEEAFDRLIYHYPKSGHAEKTVHYLTLFARHAAGGYAHLEAARALHEALGQVESLPEDVRDRKLIELLLQLAESLLPLAAFPETRELFERHLERLEALDDPSLAGPYYFWLAHTFTYLGQQEKTQEYAQMAIAAAQECADETTEGKARYVLGRDGFWSGKFRSGIENSLRAVVLLERNGEPWWQGQAHWVAGFNHYALGQFREAIEALERTYELGEALDDYRLDTSWSLGHFHASLGEVDTGIDLCRRGLERSQDPLNSAVSAGFLGHAQLQEGRRLEEAAVHLDRSTGLMAEAGMQQLEGWFSTFLAEALLEQGKLEEARTAATRGLDSSRESRFWYGVGLAEGALGRVATAAEDFSGAREWFDRARERFAELQAPLEVARVDLELGRLARLAGDPAIARERLEDARRRFDELQVPFWSELAVAEATTVGNDQA
ncbi:MAG: AAA family ATPase [Acidobacteriota bacterium]